MSVELGTMGTDGKFGGNAGRAARSAPDSDGDDLKADRKASDVAMEPAADDVRKTLGGGVDFVKHAHTKSLSAQRTVWYHEIGGKGYVCWQPTGGTQLTYDPKRSVPLTAIRMILLGKQSQAFTRRHAANVADDRAFSLETDRRTLDLEAPSGRVRDSWLKNLKILLGAFDVNYKLRASPNSRETEDKEMMEKRGPAVKFQVHVRCKNLPRRLEAAELDSVCVGFERLEQSGHLMYLAQTDQIKENDSPAYGQALVLPYYAGAKQLLKIAVYAVDGSMLAEDQQIGFAQVPFSQLVDGPGLGEEIPFQLKSNDPAKDKKLKENKSQMFLTCTPALLSEAELLSKMQRIFMAGDSFYLYHSKHPASRVLVFFRKATHDKPDMLYWCRDNTVDKNGRETKEKPRCVEFVDCCMPLLSITDIYLGRQSAAFERPPANKAPADRCFSFKSNHQGRVLDLQAKSPQVRDAWVFGLMALIRQTQAQNRIAARNVKTGSDKLQLHNEPAAPRRTPIPHSHNFKVTLALACRNLPDNTDPLVGVFTKSAATQKLKFVDHTETQMDRPNPSYAKRVVVDYGDPQGASNDVRLTVYNVETPQIREKDTLGFATVGMTQLLDSAGREIILPLTNPRNKSLNRTLSEKKAVVVVRNLQALPQGTVEIKAACRGLISLDGNSMGSKHWVLVAYESIAPGSAAAAAAGAGAGAAGELKDEKSASVADTKTRATSPTASATHKAAKVSSVPVRYFGQTEALRDSSAGAADFKKSIGAFDFRGGENKIIKLAVFVVKDDAAAAGIRDFTEKQQEEARIGTAFINLDNLLISGEPTVTLHFTNAENRGREMRLKHEDAHAMITYSFKPTNPPAAAAANGADEKGLSPMYRVGGALPSGGTVSAAALNAALAGQGNAVGTVSIPAIIAKLQAKMAAGRTFIQYIAGQMPTKINMFYRENDGKAGTLYWHAAGTAPVPNPAQAIAVDAISHVYHGKQFPALAPAPVTNDLLFSIVTATAQLHLQCNSPKTRDQWVYGIMGILQHAGSNAKLHQDTGAANGAISPGGPKSGTLKAFGTGKSTGSPQGTAKQQLAAAKGHEIAIALNLPALPASTQKMLALMFQGKKFIRYPFTSTEPAATVSKVFFRAAANRLGTLYWGDVNTPDNADLNSLSASGQALPVHLISDITLGNGGQPFAPLGATVQPPHCLSFVAKSTGQSLHLEAKDVKQATLWAKTVQSLCATGGVNVTFAESQNAAAAAAGAGAGALAAPVPLAVPVLSAVAVPAAVPAMTFTPAEPITGTTWSPPPPPGASPASSS